MEREMRFIDPVRSEAQLEDFRKACAVTNRVCELITAEIRAGITELMLLDAFIACAERAKRELKPEKRCATMFVIIESGERTALLHGRATNRRICEGDFVTLDFGLSYGEAYADMTRTFAVGGIDDEKKRIYETVLNAIRACEESFRPGINGEEADNVARKVIADAGYGDKFIHGLGHGFGSPLDPYVTDGTGLAQGCEEVLLLKDMVFTIEPGIYVEGLGGVRIEDTVIMGDAGVEPLFSFTKELIIL